MIVRTNADGSLVLIAQTNHAELSGMFAAHWGNETFARPQPYHSVVRGTIYHDAGWYRYEARPAYDVAAKRTPSFGQVPPDPAQLAAYQWAIDWMSGIDPYAGLLISRHRTGLWRGRYGRIRNPPPRQASPGDLVAAFVEVNEARQEQALAKLDRDAFLTNYHNLQIWDLLSLHLCLAQEPQGQTFEPVLTDYDPAVRKDVRMKLTPLSGGRFELDPYPFDVRPLDVHYLYKHLPTHVFPAEDAFLEAYYAAVPQLRQFQFC
ncbi:MAG TPA: DUF3891 family protein [Xanthobacteraceae bacterium]